MLSNGAVVLLGTSQVKAYNISLGRLAPGLCSVFQIFDDDGDGLLSYQEFVAMMKDRIHRGLKSYSRYKTHRGLES